MFSGKNQSLFGSGLFLVSWGASFYRKKKGWWRAGRHMQ
jgi:hypothetical protein